MTMQEPSPVKYDSSYSVSLHYKGPEPFISKKEEEKMDGKKMEPGKNMGEGTLDIKYDRHVSDDYKHSSFRSWKATAEDIKPADKYNAPVSSTKKTVQFGAVLGPEKKIHVPNERDTHPGMYVNDDRVVISDWNEYGPQIQRAYNIKTIVKGMQRTFSGEARPEMMSYLTHLKGKGATFDNSVEAIGVGDVESVLKDEFKEKRPYMLVHSLDEAVAEIDSFEKHKAVEEQKLRREIARVAGIPKRKQESAADEFIQEQADVNKVMGNYQHADIMGWLAHQGKQQKSNSPGILRRAWNNFTGQDLEERLDVESDPVHRTRKAYVQRIIP